MHVEPGQSTKVMPRHFKTFPHKFPVKTLNRWQDKIQDTEVLKKARMQSVHTLLKLAQLRWTGYVTRMPYEQLPKKSFLWRTSGGKALSRRLKTRYKDTLKVSLKDYNIPTESWEQTAHD